MGKAKDFFEEDKDFSEHSITRYEAKEILYTKPCNEITRITQNPYFLWDVAEEDPGLLLTKDWGRISGAVRNQRSHENCWTYPVTDAFSAMRMITKEDDQFRTFSAKYLTFYASPMLRHIEKEEGRRKDKHHCHGYDLKQALRFIQETGVPEEDPEDAYKDFNCITDRPEENPTAMYKIGEEVEIRVSNKIKDLYEMIFDQPVAADLLWFYPELDRIGSRVYEGPESEESYLRGIHSVLITAIKRVNGKLVAFCKSSHGEGKGDGGYINVSLTRMILGTGPDSEIESASFLLRNFTCPIIPKPSESEKDQKKKRNKTHNAPEGETEREKKKNRTTLSLSKTSPLVVTKQPEERFEREHFLMLPKWMIDVPEKLSQDWYVLARPAGKRCIVVSSDGTTVSRVRNGSILHRFPSALPGGARKKGTSGPSQSYTKLDCIFHEPDQTYYVIDMICWRGYSLYECTAEFRFFWVQSKLDEIGACDPPSFYHKFRFSAVPFHNCDQSGLHSAYTGSLPYVKDGLLFYNKQAHYHTGSTPLVLRWKDDKCSQYVIDTDYNGKVPRQHIVLELHDDGKLVTSDDPPVTLGRLNEERSSGLSSGSLVRFAIGDGGLSFVEGRLEKTDLQCIAVSNRAFPDSYSKIMFQHKARSSPLKIEDIAATISHENQQEDKRD